MLAENRTPAWIADGCTVEDVTVKLMADYARAGNEDAKAFFASVGDKEEETAETTEVVADTAAAPAVDTAPAAPAPAVEAAKEEVKKEETPKAETKTEAAKEDKTKSAAAEKSTKKSAAKSEKKAAAAPAPKKEKAAPAQAAPKNSGQSYGKKERSKSIPDF